MPCIALSIATTSLSIAYNLLLVCKNKNAQKLTVQFKMLNWAMAVNACIGKCLSMFPVLTVDLTVLSTLKNNLYFHLYPSQNTSVFGVYTVVYSSNFTHFWGALV